MSSTHELISHLAAHAGSLAALAIPADPPPATLWQPVAASTTYPRRTPPKGPVAASSTRASARLNRALKSPR